MNHPWSTWWETDLPCQFSRERALENCDYLLEKLPNIAKALDSPGVQNHPLFQCWRNNGAMSFLEINALAEDLRCIDAVPGINEVIRGLLSSELCKPTWHVIHSAAMFAREKGNRMSRFSCPLIVKTSIGRRGSHSRASGDLRSCQPLPMLTGNSECQSVFCS